jgi:putative redox protein
MARRVCLWASSCTAITLRQYADQNYDYAGDITAEVPYHGPGAEGAARYLQRVLSLSERVPEPDLGVMMDLAECAPVTLLLQFAWSVRSNFHNP